MIQIAANCTIYALYKLRQRGAPIYAGFCDVSDVKQLPDANLWLAAHPDVKGPFTVELVNMTSNRAIAEKWQSAINAKIASGTMQPGTVNTPLKVTGVRRTGETQPVRNIVTGETWPSIADAARAAGITKQCLSQALKNNSQYRNLIIDNNVDTD